MLGLVKIITIDPILVLLIWSSKLNERGGILPFRLFSSISFVWFRPLIHNTSIEATGDALASKAWQQKCA